MKKNKEFFCVSASKYVPGKDFFVVRPASLNFPKDNAVMFITTSHILEAPVLETVSGCLVFWPDTIDVPESIEKKHAVVQCAEPHTEYCVFYKENNIRSLPMPEEYNLINGSYISKSARIGENALIMPGVYICGNCEIGDNVYIGCGTKIVGDVHIGNNVTIRENCVIGTDATTTDRISTGQVISMPQFGDVIIEDDVLIGAFTVIARGAIDSTILRRGSRTGMGACIGHNTELGEDSIVIGGAIMAGSSSVGKQSMISFNASIRNFAHVGDHVTVGMGSVVTKDVPDGVVVKGNPAR